jgi:hypothetical protein
MVTKKTKKAARRSRTKSLRKAKKLEANKPLDSYSFGASRYAKL